MRAIYRFFKNLYSRIFHRSEGQPMPPPETVPSEPETIPPDESSSSDETDHPELEIGDIRGTISQEEYNMVVDGFILAREIIYSKEFREEVLQYKFNPRLTNGMNNGQILDLYTSKSMAVKIEMFTGSWWENHRWGTVAYEANAEGYIRLNRYFVTKPLHVTSTILHELAHGFGFTHPKLEKDSVSYGMNEICNIVAKRLGLSEALALLKKSGNRILA